MPLNTLRLNHAPSSHPNDRIVFIKPLTRPASLQKDYEIADLLLRAIAAQCLPIMKSNYLSVTTLEEHEPNREFIGRNFNNGEIIQLVLQSRKGNWLSVPVIQMVMMHELAHNVQMNHGKKFWDLRNAFAKEMKVLWAKGYSGEGLWGSGRVLGDLESQMRGHGGGGGGVVGSEELKHLPLCGGTFKSRRTKGRGRKRKRKRQINARGDELSWKEKKEKRIEKKFGKNGVALGEDVDKRLRLEFTGKGPLGVKPRVAQSKRSRELRAAAALARFASNRKEVEILETFRREQDEDTKNEEERDDDDDADENGDGEYDDDGGDTDQDDALDSNGKILVDKNGHSMVRICNDNDTDAQELKQEMEELAELDINHIRQHRNEDDHKAHQEKSTDARKKVPARDRNMPANNTTARQTILSFPRQCRTISGNEDKD